MFRTPGRTATRLSAMAVATGLAAAGVIGFAGAAQADGVKGEYKGFAEGQGMQLELDLKGQPHGGQGGLMKLDVDGGPSLSVYCIDKDNPTRSGNRYEESDWDGTWLGDGGDANERRAKLKWILNNSFPTSTVAQLKEKSGAKDLDAMEAGAATQAAIWHFSDRLDLNAGRQKNDDVAKLYEYLVKNAKADDASEPKISLELDPDHLTGSPADKAGVGPFTVKTNAKGTNISAALKAGAPAGTKLVDKNGAEVKVAGDQTQLYVKAPAGSEQGEATVQVSGKSTMEAGRVFKATKAKTQLLILAGKSEVEAKDESVATWKLKGANPAFDAKEQCKDGGVEVTATNTGDTDFKFKLDGKDYTVKPGDKLKQLVKVGEDQAYNIAVKDSEGKVLKSFEGVLDCKTDTTTGGATGGGETAKPSASPSTSTSPSAAASAPANPKGPDLAATGSDGSNTPVILGGAGALVLVGGGLVFYTLRRRNGSTGAAA